MELSGHNIVGELKKDNRDAFKFIFRSFYLDLYYKAFKYTCQKEDAKDLVQSTFIKIWEKRKELIENKPLEPLLYTIHKNNCLDYLKLRKIKTEYSPGDPAFDTDKHTPFDHFLSKELEIKINNAIADLPLKCREIFEYSRFKGLKYAEIAIILNISVKTVENQMSIALDKLRKSLVDYLPFLLIISIF